MTTGEPPTTGPKQRHRVLGCVGASPWLSSQIRTLLRLAGALEAELVLLHVSLPGADAGEVRGRIEESLAQLGGTADILTASGRSPNKVILREVERRKIDLVYAGAAPHEPVLTDILGSTARRIARNARCSVLLDSARHRESDTFPIAVVATPLDESAVWMLGFAARLAEAGIVRTIHAVHEILPAPSSAVRTSDAAWRINRARAEAEFRELISSIDLGGQPVRSACVEGRDLGGVVGYARAEGADLVICRGPRRRIQTLGRLIGDEYENLLTDLPSALLLLQRGLTSRGDHR